MEATVKREAVEEEVKRERKRAREDDGTSSSSSAFASAFADGMAVLTRAVETRMATTTSDDVRVKTEPEPESTGEPSAEALLGMSERLKRRLVEKVRTVRFSDSFEDFETKMKEMRDLLQNLMVSKQLFDQVEHEERRRKKIQDIFRRLADRCNAHTLSRGISVAKGEGGERFAFEGDDV